MSDQTTELIRPMESPQSGNGEDPVRRVIEKHRGNRGGLIAILEHIQEKHGYLPEQALRDVAQETGKPLVDIYRIATFYRAFSLKPRGKHVCSVCMGTACHVRGAPRVEQQFERELGIPPGETTVDKEFSLETVNCLGACALGPVVVVDGKYFSGVTTMGVKKILEEGRAGLNTVDVRNDRGVFPLDLSCSRCNHPLKDPEYPIDGFPSIRLAISLEGKQGWLRLSALYGRHTYASNHRITPDTIVQAYCPYCHSTLEGKDWCMECGARMFSMIVREAGILQVCSRRGCTGQMLDVF